MVDRRLIPCFFTAVLTVMSLCAGADDSHTTAANLLVSYLRTLPACMVSEFKEDGYLRHVVGGETEIPLNQIDRDLVQLDQGWPLANLSSRPLQQGEQLWRRLPPHPSFNEALKGLVDRARQAGLQSFPVKLLYGLAKHVYTDEKASSKVGACYRISQVTGTFNTVWMETAPLPSSVQSAIRDLFLKPETQSPLAEIDLQRIGEGEFDETEVRELRALRAATRLFEENTALKDDVGNFLGNMDFGGKIRSVCRSEALTYTMFVEELIDQKLVRRFETTGTWLYRPNMIPIDGHAGTLIRSKRTGKLYVIDSWLDDGGKPARLLRASDWLKKQDTANLVTEG